MGMYTELFLQVELKEDTPVEVLDTLRYMMGEEVGYTPAKPFEAHRWDFMLRCSSFYHYPFAHSYLDGDPYVGYKGYFLFVRCDFKNYTGELSGFLEWIAPYVYGDDSHYEGHWRYEEDEEPTRIRFGGGKVHY